MTGNRKNAALSLLALSATDRLEVIARGGGLRGARTIEAKNTEDVRRAALSIAVKTSRAVEFTTVTRVGRVGARSRRGGVAAAVARSGRVASVAGCSRVASVAGCSRVASVVGRSRVASVAR